VLIRLDKLQDQGLRLKLQLLQRFSCDCRQQQARLAHTESLSRSLATIPALWGHSPLKYHKRITKRRALDQVIGWQDLAEPSAQLLFMNEKGKTNWKGLCPYGLYIRRIGSYIQLAKAHGHFHL
jgi:hypothetical protein